MGRVLRVTAKEVTRVLEKMDFTLARSKGSHRVYRHEDGRRTVVPFHGTDVLHPKTLATILKDVELSAEDFERRLRGK